MIVRVRSALLVSTLWICALAQQAPIHQRGTITDAISHRPVAGAQVSIVGGAARRGDTTDANGLFDIPLVSTIQAGEPIRIHVQKSGYENYEETIPATDKVPRPIAIIPAGHHQQKGENPSSPAGKTIVSAPNGVAISGGTVGQVTVNNNYGISVRSISETARSSLVAALSTHAGTIAVTTRNPDQETTDYAISLVNIFHSAGWNTQGPNVVNAPPDVGEYGVIPIPKGLIIFAPSEEDATALFIQQSLKNYADVDARIEKSADPRDAVPSLFVGTNDWNPSSMATTPEFSGDVDFKIISGMESRSTPFARVLETPGGCAIEPIQVLMFIRITNNASHEKMITEYVVEQGYKQNETWTWWRLRRLDLRSGALIMFSTKGKEFSPAVGVTINAASGNTSTSLTLVDPKDGDYKKSALFTATLLDTQIGNVNLAPGHSAVGWTAFQYTSYHGGLDTRISITDERGKKYHILSLSKSIQDDISVSPHLLTITSVLDASACTIRNIPYQPVDLR